jgi:hypothetical protein
MTMDSKIRPTGRRLGKLNFFLWRGSSARRKLVHQRRFICLGWLLCGLLASIARADTFQLNDGSTLTGDIVSYDENSLRVRLPDGNYSNPVGWTNFSQADLKKFAQDPKMEKFASQYVEVTEEQRIQKTEVTVTQPHRLKHPASSSLFGAMLSSSVGLFVIVLLYAAGIYAAYEVALFRRRPPALVCGLAAIPGLGFLSPIIFLSLPTQARAGEEEEELHEGEVAAPAEAPAFTVPGMAPPAPEASVDTGGLKLHHNAEAAPGAALPPTQVFQRGAFMFNRRFFETKFSGFFGIIRRDAEKDMIIIIKSARGEYSAERISRISANDLHAQVRKGQATEEVTIPFTEIQEVQLKHKDSP